MRFGTRAPLVTGLPLAALGLALLARAPADGQFAVDVLPGVILLGVAAGIACNPVLLAAMGRRRSGAGRPRLRTGQHLVHDGRRPRTGRAGRAAVSRTNHLVAAGEDRAAAPSGAALALD
jgi:hypothetical protein